MMSHGNSKRFGDSRVVNAAFCYSSALWHGVAYSRLCTVQKHTQWTSHTDEVSSYIVAIINCVRAGLRVRT